MIPRLDQSEHRQFWYRLEVAKRRLVFTLLELGLLVQDSQMNLAGPTFEFKADPQSGGEPVLTGHANGVITINLLEVNDVERAKRRYAMREPHRTLLARLLANPFQHFQARHAWELEVQQYQARQPMGLTVDKLPGSGQIIDGLLPIADHMKRIAYIGLLEGKLEQVSVLLLIFDIQNASISYEAFMVEG